jgi:hypothetical protein
LTHTISAWPPQLGGYGECFAEGTLHRP